MNNSVNDKNLEAALARELDQLKSEIPPSRDLWPGIDHAINNETVTLSKRLVLTTGIAASLVLAISLTITGTLFLNSTTPNEQSVAGFISLLQIDHEKNKQALLVEYQNQTVLAPDWEIQMQQLEQAEQAIYEALREEASNVELIKILRHVQAKQIELIESVYAPLFTTI